MNKPLEATFDETDKNLFEVDDLRLRADALQHSVLPRLHVLLNQCVALVTQVYEVDVFQDSIVSYFPHFRQRRSRELRLGYDSAYVSLGGKRTKNKWHGFQRADGKPVQIVPFRLGIALRHDGMSLNLDHWLSHLTEESFRKLFQFHLEFEGLTHSVCYRSGLAPTESSTTPFTLAALGVIPLPATLSSQLLKVTLHSIRSMMLTYKSPEALRAASPNSSTRPTNGFAHSMQLRTFLNGSSYTQQLIWPKRGGRRNNESGSCPHFVGRFSNAMTGGVCPAAEILVLVSFCMSITSFPAHVVAKTPLLIIRLFATSAM